MTKKKRTEAQYAEFNLFDAEGNQTLHSQYKLPKIGKLGGGWVAFYKRSIRNLIAECPNFSTMKVYLYIASKQTYQKCAIVKNAHIMKTLNMSSSTVHESLKWLKNHDYMQKYTIDGNTGWLLNPSVTGCGGNSKKSKERLWRLGIERRKAELEKDIEKRKALLETLDGMIMKVISDEDEEDIIEEVQYGDADGDDDGNDNGDADGDDDGDADGDADGDEGQEELLGDTSQIHREMEAEVVDIRSDDEARSESDN